MTIPVITGFDAMSRDEYVLPVTQMAAGYDTQAGGGTGYIAWTSAQWARHLQPYPALHIDQDPAASDPLADYLDVEARAASEAQIVSWLARAQNDYRTGARPGQRWPGIYCSASNVPSAVVILQRAGLVNVPFIVADYSVSAAEAARRVSTAIGPYPAVGYQYNDTAFGGKADTNVWALPWVKNVSTQPVKGADMPFGQLLDDAFIPVPPGVYKILYLYRDFVPVGSPMTVRVAVHSIAHGYTVHKVSLTSSVPYSVGFAYPDDTDAISLVLTDGVGPVGYTLA